jgi:hypothetical protein
VFEGFDQHQWRFRLGCDCISKPFRAMKKRFESPWCAR